MFIPPLKSGFDTFQLLNLYYKVGVNFISWLSSLAKAWEIVKDIAVAGLCMYRISEILVI